MTPKARSSRRSIDALTRRERHEELIRYAIDGAVEQVQRAYDIASGNGAININVLWEMGGAQRVLQGVLERTKGLVAGVTCGAGMPYKLSEIAESLQRQLPADHQLGAGVPRAVEARLSQGRRADGRGGLRGPVAGRRAQRPVSNAEDPLQAGGSLSARQGAARDDARRGHCRHVPIIMAGGVWYLREWDNWIDNPELGQIAFQFGTRPLLTEESPIPEGWKDALRRSRKATSCSTASRRPASISSAVRNPFLREPRGAQRAADRLTAGRGGRAHVPARRRRKGKNFWVHQGDRDRARAWLRRGLHRGAQDARRHPGVRHARRERR